MQAFNPYLPSYEYVPDGEPRIFGDRLYVFGSHDHFGGKDFCLGDYVCWSAPLTDLGNWRYDGVIYRRNQDPKNQEGKWVMNAPDVIQGPDGRFYLYYQISMLTVASVAVAARPEGPYEFYGYVRWPDGHALGDAKDEIYCFDPSIFIDDDGRIYLYVGFSPGKGFFRNLMKMMKRNFDGGFGIELEADMLTVRGEPVMVAPGPIMAKGTSFEGHGFYEASSMRKINGKYYFVYSSILSHELCYATGDSPLGSFTYGGTLVSIGDVGYQGRKEPNNYTGNTHGGMAQINGQWYVFYHRQTNKQKCARQGCAEKVFIQPDGSIAQVEVTSCGLNDGPLLGRGKYDARIACNLYSGQGVFMYRSSFEKDKKGIHPYFTQSGQDRNEKPDQYIANMTDGSVAGFKYFCFDHAVRVGVTVRGFGEGKLLVYTNLHGNPIAEIPITPSAQWRCAQAWNTVQLAGTQPIFFMFKGTGTIDFRSFELQEVSQ